MTRGWAGVWGGSSAVALMGVILIISCLDFSGVQPSVQDARLREQCEVQAPQGAELPEPFGIQLHTHGLSNHGSSSRPASMQFGSYQAQKLGLDGIWWSDHLPYYRQHDSILIVPSDGRLDPQLLNVTGLKTDASRLGAVLTGPGTASAQLTDSELVMRASGGTPATPTRIRYFTQHVWIDGQARWPESLKFNRPVSSEAQVALTYRFCGDVVGPLHLVVRLDWHVDSLGVERQHQVHYVLTPGSGSEERTLEAPGVERISRFVPTRGTVVLDLMRDVDLLPDGDDNSIVDISWYVEASDITVHCAAVRQVVLRSAAPSFGANWFQAARFSERYQERVGVRELIGFEGWVIDPTIAGAGFGNSGLAGQHTNVYLPSPDPALAEPFLTLSGDALVHHAHELCGVATINHPYGYGFVIPDSATRLSVRARVIQFMLDHQAFGADLLEVGLPRRGDFLDGHLLLWDVMSANGIRLCGVGTSDAHGWRWDDPATATFTENRNPFVTWLWTRNRSRVGLVSALRRCRVFFGNPFTYRGKIDFAVIGGGVMGETLPVQRDSATLAVRIGRPAGMMVWLIQGEVQPGDSVHYLRQEALTLSQTSVRVGVARPCFVRFEVRTDAGERVAFSNPVWFARPRS